MTLVILHIAAKDSSLDAFATTMPISLYISKSFNYISFISNNLSLDRPPSAIFMPPRALDSLS